jgi:hypothetical protein
MYNETTHCKACKRLIKFIRTSNGKNMPVDFNMVDFLPDPEGKDIAYYDYKVSTSSGYVNAHTKGYFLDKPCEGSERVYRPHWATCTRPDKFKKPAPKKPKKAAAPPPPLPEPYVQINLFEGATL